MLLKLTFFGLKVQQNQAKGIWPPTAFPQPYHIIPLRHLCVYWAMNTYFQQGYFQLSGIVLHPFCPKISLDLVPFAPIIPDSLCSCTWEISSYFQPKCVHNLFIVSIYLFVGVFFGFFFFCCCFFPLLVLSFNRNSSSPILTEDDHIPFSPFMFWNWTNLSLLVSFHVTDSLYPRTF